MRVEILPGPCGPCASRWCARAARALLGLIVGWAACGAKPAPLPVTGALAAPTFEITVARCDNGTFWPSSGPVERGGDVRLHVVPVPGFRLDTLYVDGVPVRPARTLVLRDVTAPHVVAATFCPNEYTITATAAPHATISPSGIVPVTHGGDQAFTLVADPGFQVVEVVVDGKPVRAHDRYTFIAVKANHQIVARTSHHAARVIAPGAGERWRAGETREVRWQPLEAEEADSAEVRVSAHGIDGPWEPIWRGLLRTGSALWQVPAIDCDSLVFCVATMDTLFPGSFDTSAGIVSVRDEMDSRLTRFFVQAIPSPASAGPVRLDYSLPSAGEAALEIYTVSGRAVWRQPLGVVPAGRRSAIWDGRLDNGRQAEPGIYFARLTTGQGERNCRLVLLP